MDPGLENVIRQALADARAAGRDYLTQTELAVRAVLKVRPDMTASEALTAVNLVRRSYARRLGICQHALVGIVLFAQGE